MREGSAGEGPQPVGLRCAGSAALLSPAKPFSHTSQVDGLQDRAWGNKVPSAVRYPGFGWDSSFFS